MSAEFYDAWALPVGRSGGAETLEHVAGSPPGGRHLAATPEWLGALVSLLAGDRTGPAPTFAAGGTVPLTALERAAVLGGVGLRFFDVDDPLRHEALRRLPESAGVSPAMAEAVLEGMAADWTPDRLTRLLREEFGDPEVLDRFVERRGRAVKAVPPRFCLQVVSGSVPGVGATALVRSLLVGAPTLLKPGGGDALLPTLFARGIRETAPDLAARLAVVYWESARRDLLEVALSRADVVTVYGGDATVAEVRGRARPDVHVVGYGHREGLGVVGRDVFESTGTVERVAGGVARAAALFDQRGCVSTRTVYIEDSSGAGSTHGVERTAHFATCVADALSALERSLPSGSLSPVERSGVHQLRGTAEMLSAGWDENEPGRLFVRHGGRDPWTVVHDPTWSLETNAVGRVVLIRPFRSLERVFHRLRQEGSRLQTVGVAGLGERLDAVANAFAHLGVSRITPFEKVPFPAAWWHHDGQGPLRDLVRWTDLERDGLELEADEG